MITRAAALHIGLSTPNSAQWCPFRARYDHLCVARHAFNKPADNAQQACGDVLTKKKLDQHRNQCRGANFACLDCMVHFHGTEYRSHTSCISEAQKYQGALYREKGKKDTTRSNVNGAHDSRALVPKKAYVEEVPEGAMQESQAVANIEVPPRAPTPPSAVNMPENVNVFDFLVSEETPAGPSTIGAPDERHMGEQQAHMSGGDSQYSQYSTGDGSHFLNHGFSYGNHPVQAEFVRYGSFQSINDSQLSEHHLPPPPYTTPAPKEHQRVKSDKKRKRHNVDELDLSSSLRPPSRDQPMVDAPGTTIRLNHSGLTGGLSRLITSPDFYGDRISAGPTPISPVKRNKSNPDKEPKERRKVSYASHSTASKLETHKSDDRKRAPRPRSIERVYHSDRHHRGNPRHESMSSDDRPQRKHLKAIEYRGRSTSVEPAAGKQMISYMSHAELFMSFITKGPDSERGCSINKVLKRYHRGSDFRADAKYEGDKDLWKSLRLKRNDRGEIVLFAN